MSASTGPTKLGPYEIVGRIGGGGMARVFLGRKTDAAGRETMAALKVIRAELATEEQFVTMFADEARMLARLDHPNISRTLEIGLGDHLAFIAMELLLGRTLGDVWEAAEATGLVLPLDLAAWICAHVARGLHYAHELTDEDGQPFHLVHRDVNPSNIFVTYTGTIKLFDFGLAKSKGRRSPHTQSGIVKGKVPYLSPEQVLQLPIDRRSDVFSLGTTLYELTTMRRLFKRENDLASIIAIRDGDVPDPAATVPLYPPELWAIVQRALAKDQDKRYATAAAFADDLEAFTSGRADGLEDLAGVLLDRLFPGERNRQASWLARTASMPALPGTETMVPPAPLGSVRDVRDDELSVPLLLVNKKD